MKSVASLLVALLFLTVPVRPQAGTGSIGGTVNDPSGATVPNATVKVVNAATGEASQFKTLKDGRFLVPNLKPGTYNVSVAAPGFKTYDDQGVTLQVGDALNLTLAMQLGSTSETLTVEGETPLLDTENATTGEVVDNTFIMNLPQINRNPFELLRIAGNVQGADSAGSIPANGQSEVRINGGRTSSIDYYVDGSVVTTGRAHNLTGETPSIDAVQEFEVVTNGVSAEFGRISGGYVDLVTKSGTNHYHGDLYEYFQNDLLNAGSWLNNASGVPKSKFHQNNYGFTLGGPVSIPKLYNGQNKTFFFVDNEYLVNRQAGNAINGSMPTQAERSGDFTNTQANGIPTLMYDPNGAYGGVVTDPLDGVTGVQRLTLLGGDGKHVAQNLINPTSAAILSLLPLPNQAPNTSLSSDANNYLTTQSTSINNFRIGVRVDELISSKQQLAISFRRFDSGNGQSQVGGPLFTANQQNSQGGDNGNINYTYTFSPTLLFNARASVIFNPYVSGSLLPASTNAALIKLSPNFASIIGLNDIPTTQIDFMNAGAATAGINGYYSGTNSSNQMNSTTYDFNFITTKILNRHALKFGVETRRYYDNFAQFGYGGIPNLITFDGNPVAYNANDHGFDSLSSAPNSLGAFELGIADWTNASGEATRAMNVNYNGLFVQDDFKISNKLTVNMGLRWDREGPTTERNGKIYFWDPNAPSVFSLNPSFNWQTALSGAGLPTNLPEPSWVANGLPKGAIGITGTPQYPSRVAQNVDSHQFAPRLGFAYQVTPKTVVRAFGGLMYLPTTGDAGSYSTASSNIPLANAGQSPWHASNDNQQHYLSTWDNPFPQPGDVTTYTRDIDTVNVQGSINPGVSAFSRNMHMPREYNWSASIQRELPWNFVIEAGYSGNRGLGLLAAQLISSYPRPLYTPAYSNVMTTSVPSPILLHGQPVPSNGTLGPTQALGILEYPYPQYGTVNVLGSNIGSSFYNSLNIRLERRFSNGLSFLLNYTYSHLLDDVGGPEADSSGGPTANGQGGKAYQTLYPGILAVWGVSANDVPNHLTMAYNYQFPFGKGRRWLGSPKGLGENILDKVAGGWQFSGYTVYSSGSPVAIGSDTSNAGNAIEVNTTFPTYAGSDTNLAYSGYKGDNESLLSPSGNLASLSPRLDVSKLMTAQGFVYGNVPPVIGSIRNPPFKQTDLSLMKNFVFTETRYLQFRVEAQNAFNIRGFGTYDGNVGDPAFGLVTSAGNVERHLQVSARLIF